MLDAGLADHFGRCKVSRRGTGGADDLSERTWQLALGSPAPDEELAAPVRDQDGEVVGAVSVVVPTGTRTDTVVPAVRTCGLAISRALGWATP